MKKNVDVLRAFLGIFLWVSLIAVAYLSYYAFSRSEIVSIGKYDPLVVLSVVFSLPIYFVVFKYSLRFFEKNLADAKKEAVLAPQSTVEGILDQKTREALDKDGDGEIMISEYYTLTEEEVLQKIVAVDPRFSKEDFYAWVKHLYSTILESLDKQNPIMLRRFESDYLYQRHVALFENIKECGATISNYAIKGVLLKDFKVEGDKEILVAALSASINKKTKYDDSFKSYILTFARKKGVKTTGTLLDKETNCPNCGAVLDLDSHGVCAYCKTVVSNGDYGWILIDMKSIQLVGGKKGMN